MEPPFKLLIEAHAFMELTDRETDAQYKGLSPGCLAGLQAEWFDRTELESQD